MTYGIPFILYDNTYNRYVVQKSTCQSYVTARTEWQDNSDLPFGNEIWRLDVDLVEENFIFPGTPEGHKAALEKMKELWALVQV